MPKNTIVVSVGGRNFNRVPAIVSRSIRGRGFEMVQATSPISLVQCMKKRRPMVLVATDTFLLQAMSGIAETGQLHVGTTKLIVLTDDGRAVEQSGLPGFIVLKARVSGPLNGNLSLVVAEAVQS